MKEFVLLGLLLPALALAFATGPVAAEAAEPEFTEHLAHIVMFTLKDQSKESRLAFIASCQKYLTRHEGVLSFSVGEIARDVVEPVSDREFDVALHVVFKNKAASDAYQVSPRHKEFVAENKAKFAKVRVFDSYLAKPALSAAKTD